MRLEKVWPLSFYNQLGIKDIYWRSKANHVRRMPGLFLFTFGLGIWQTLFTQLEMRSNWGMCKQLSGILEKRKNFRYPLLGKRVNCLWGSPTHQATRSAGGVWLICLCFALFGWLKEIWHMQSISPKIRPILKVLNWCDSFPFQNRKSPNLL